MNTPDMRDLVPHSGTMVLLDRVLSVDGDGLCAEVAIHAGSVFCEHGEVGAWVGIEYMAQAIAAHAGYCARLRGEPVKLGFLLGSRRYTSRVGGFRAGTVLTVCVQRVLQGENGLGAFECRIEDDSATALATALVTVFQPPDVDAFLHGAEYE